MAFQGTFVDQLFYAEPNTGKPHAVGDKGVVVGGVDILGAGQLTLGGDVVLSRSAADVLLLASGDQVRAGSIASILTNTAPAGFILSTVPGTATAAKGRVLNAADSQTHLTENAYFDGTNWQRDDVNSAVMAVRLTTGPGFLVRRAAAAANPITFTDLITGDATGISFFGVATAAQQSIGVAMSGITSSSAGTALAEPGAGYVQAEQQQNYRRIQDRLNDLRTILINFGLAV